MTTTNEEETTPAPRRMRADAARVVVPTDNESFDDLPPIGEDEEADDGDEPTSALDMRRRLALNADEDAPSREAGTTVLDVTRARVSTPQQALRVQTLHEINSATQTMLDIIGTVDAEQRRGFKVSLARTSPPFVMDRGQRIDIAGHLETYDYDGTPESLPNEDMIRETHGGGNYQLRIGGPDPASNRAFVWKKTIPVKIAGRPKLPLEESDNAKEGSESRLAEKMLEAAEKDKQRLAAEARAAAEKAERNAQSTQDRLEKFMLESFRGREVSPETLKIQMEERARDEERRREEREERRRQDELAERRHQEALAANRIALEEARKADERRHELALATMRQQMEMREQEYKLQMEMQREERRRDEDRRREDAKAAEERAFKQQQMLLEQSSKQFEMMQSVGTMKTEFLTQQIAELSKGKSAGGFDELLKAKKVLDLLRGKDEEGGAEQETWEKVMDKVESLGGSLLKGLPALMAGTKAGRTVQKRRPQIEPGSVAVAELPPEKETKQIGDGVAAGPPSAPPQTGAAQGEVVEGSTNDVTEFAALPEGSEDVDQLTHFVKCLDLAIQRGLSVEEIDEKVLSLFPQDVLNMLKVAPIKVVLETVAERTPSEWAINTIEGARTLRALHTHLLEQGEEEEEEEEEGDE